MSALGGKYRIGASIGGGGMAEVFRAELSGAEGFTRAVAIKRMKRSISSDKGFAELFVREARLAAKLQHANIVQTLDFNRDENGCLYLVMELIDGVDLRHLVQSGRVPISACVFIMSEVLRALDYAHEMVDDGQPLTIVHRDISPHNIMLSWQGTVKVVDFGIAKAIAGSLVSRSGSLKGKVAYMSPEQVHGQDLDGRSDIFALGIIMHELLTGERLFVGGSEAATLSKLLTQPIALPSSLNDQVPADIDAIVMKLLARDRDQRYSRARDALNDLLESSLSVVRGRADLETVLIERFPGRVPRRVARLSSSAQEAGQASESLVPHTLPSMSSAQAVPLPEPVPALAQAPGAAFAQAGAANFSTDATLPASPKVLAASSQELADGRAQPKRTVTAPAVASDVFAGETLPDSIDEQASRPSRALRLLVPALLSLAVASGVLIYWQSRSTQARPQPGAIVLGPSRASTDDAAPTAADAGLPAVSADAAPMPVEALVADAAPSQGDASESKTREHERKSSRKASVTIKVKPWAAVTIDGKSYGQTPQTIELGEGRHRVVLENLGLDRQESFSITLKAAQNKSIDKDWR